MQSQAEELWQLIYNVFEHTSLDAGRTVMVGKGQANEMQFSLMRKIAELKHTTNPERAGTLIEEIRAGFLTMEAIQLIPSATVQAAQRILDGMNKE